MACTRIIAAVLLLAASQPSERVAAIRPPAAPLPAESESRGVTRFSFIVYGDTRGRRDGIDIQYEHSLVVDAAIAAIERRRTTPYPVRFVLQSGDAVFNGLDARQWTVSFVPLINRLTTEANVPYFLAPGNHDLTDATTPDEPARQAALHNYLDAIAAFIPPEGSPRRLAGYPTYAIAYGNAFVLALDTNIAGDERQYQWARGQLESLDRRRYPNVFVLCHQAPFSSGPHGGATVEPQTSDLRTKYMPLFRAHHVRAVFSGHEHLFEHWVERYEDATGSRRMDLIVSGGGGAPLYGYSGEPNLHEYLTANASANVRLQHLVRPGLERGLNPYHFLIVTVDGEHLALEVVGVDWGSGFQPYRSNTTDLQDPAKP